METQKTTKLADEIIQLDILINSNFQELTNIYWLLKKKNEANNTIDLKDKVSFLKSYLSRNISSYSQYNLSYDIALLSNKSKSKQISYIEILKKIGIEDDEILKHKSDPTLLKLHNYYTQQYKALMTTVNKYIDGMFQNVVMNSTLKKDWADTAKKELNSKVTDKDDKIIIEHYQKTILIDSSNIEKIECKTSRTAFISMFEQLSEMRLIKLNKNDEIQLIVGMHFTFNEKVEGNDLHSKEESEYNYIKWWGSNPKLFYFIQQLLEREIIICPSLDDLQNIIVKHFYYTKNGRLYNRKDVQDAESNMLKNINKKPIGFAAIDSLLDSLK